MATANQSNTTVKEVANKILDKGGEVREAKSLMPKRSAHGYVLKASI